MKAGFRFSSSQHELVLVMKGSLHTSPKPVPHLNYHCGVNLFVVLRNIINNLTIFLSVSLFVFGLPSNMFKEIVFIPIFLKLLVNLSLCILYFGQCRR